MKSAGGVIAENVNAVVPTFATVTDCGLSVLLDPTLVAAKFRLGGFAKSTLNTSLLPRLAKYTLPLPSTVTPVGFQRSVMMGVGAAQPLAVQSDLIIRLSPESAI